MGREYGVGVCQDGDTRTLHLYPEEEALIGEKAIPARRREFVLGRAAARDALLELGMPPAAILRGSGRQPLWPPGVTGSITHTRGTAIAAVAPQEKIDGFGIDLEYLGRGISLKNMRFICSDAEHKWVTEVDKWQQSRLTMMFSAKEAIFKAFFPRTAAYLDFKDVNLHWDAHSQGFRGRLQKSLEPPYDKGFEFDVRCQQFGAYVFSWMVIPPTGDDNS